tara:strand:+ start:1638 stop:1790 length:153 start_codon:yes stop_codon:yes gene_type:complete
VKRKFVTVEVKYDTEETWEKSLKEIEEVFLLMNNITRNASVIKVEQGVNE